MLGGCCCGADTDDAQTPGAAQSSVVLFIDASPLTFTNDGPTQHDLVGYTAPAGTFLPGDVVLVTLAGSYQNSSGAPRTPSWEMLFGGVTAYEDGWGGQGSAALDRPWSFVLRYSIEDATTVHLAHAPLEGPSSGAALVGLGSMDQIVAVAVPGATVVGGITVPDVTSNAVALEVLFNHATNNNLQRLVRDFVMVELRRAAA